MTLSAKQQAVATLIAKGFSTDEIAARLGVSPLTVAVHRRAIAGKLGLKGARTIAGIVHHAIREGWVRIGEVEP